MRKIILNISFLLIIIGSFTACDAFKTLSKSDTQSAQGRPYELVLVCNHDLWNSALGDSLRSVLAAPIPYLDHREPHFDVLRINEEGLTGFIACHRNILNILADTTLHESKMFVQYDQTAQPQVIVNFQGHDFLSMTQYLSEHRSELVQIFEMAERDRNLDYNQKFNAPKVEADLKTLFDMDMKVPLGYFTAKKGADFLWARNEYPSSSQGFMVYSYPYTGKECLSLDSLIAARNRFAQQIPGPSEGSYMTTTTQIYLEDGYHPMRPSYRTFRMDDRLWCELRGFWDVEGDYMGGPFVSYTTIDKRHNRVVTLDCYVYSPKQPKRNLMHGVEHLFYQIDFPKPNIDR